MKDFLKDHWLTSKKKSLPGSVQHIQELFQQATGCGITKEEVLVMGKLMMRIAEKKLAAWLWECSLRAKQKENELLKAMLKYYRSKVKKLDD